jgi:iron complex transport system permease protein
MSSAAAMAETTGGPRRRMGRSVVALLVAALLAILMAILSLGIGPVAISPGRVVEILSQLISGAVESGRDQIVIMDVRLPRTALAALVGSATAIAGAVMQGLFRNPLADPTIVGVSSGAALAAATWFVYGAALAPLIPFAASEYGLPISAFVGGLLVTAILHVLATKDGRTSVVALLLAGIAIAGLTTALTGLLVFVSSEQQLREFTFWTLGSLGGATWTKVGMVLPFAIVLFLAGPVLARGLDALALGEAEAFHLGIPVERLKRIAIIAVAGAIGASVAVSGVIGFFGLIVPHLVRLTIGPGHRMLLPISAFGGAAVLILADIIARVIASPAELPLGIITAAVGAPIMLSLLVQRRRTLVG